jgi:hypothetical protein
MPTIDYSLIEERIMRNSGMDTTLFDLDGTLDKAVSALKKALSGEYEWQEMEGPEKLAFQKWVQKNARNYKDGDEVDWVGAFYDWLEQ